jgi:hypothetical protein
MLRRVALVRTDVSEERIPSIFRATKFGELGTTLALTSNRSTLRRNTVYCVCLRSMRLLLVTANFVPSSPSLGTPDDGGATFLRNVGFYKSHTS